MAYYQEHYLQTCASVIDEIREALEKIDPAQTEALVREITSAEQIFFVGVGRVMLSLQAVCKRWAHLGLKTHYVGEITEPAITERDVLIVGSGSGETMFPAGIAKKAKAAGAKVIHIGSNPNGAVSECVSLMVRIPVRTKLYLEDEVESIQPMTSLFEQCLLIFGDIVAKMMIDEKRIDMKALWQYHANLE